MKKVLVIGAGPAGMMAAITASKKCSVILADRNEKVGKKLFITGKGRCNVTNFKDISEFFDYIPKNNEFLYSSLYSFTNNDTINFFENHGVKLKVERGDRVFPQSDKSSDIIKALESELHSSNVKILLNHKVKNFKVKDNKIISANFENGEELKADYFIICTGGKSYPSTGSTGDGYKFAEDMGHTVTKLKPSLVPVEIADEWIHELQGLSLKNVNLKIVNDKNKTIHEDFGEMIFTHFGISGPIVLSASSYIDSTSKLYAVINLKPALSIDELDKRIQRDFQKNINRDFKNSLDDLLPKKIIPVIIKLSEINENKKVNTITKEERKRLVYLLQNLKLKIKGLRPIEEAIITSGGICTNEIDPSTMRSKIIKNLAFAGEVIDVDALTGGFNVQIAISTGFLAGGNANE